MWSLILILSLVINGFPISSKGSEHTCSWGMCSTYEDCCGPNTCCPQYDGTLVFIAGIIGAVLFIAICCVSFYCNLKRICSWMSKIYIRRSSGLILLHNELSGSSTTIESGIKYQDH